MCKPGALPSLFHYNSAITITGKWLKTPNFQIMGFFRNTPPCPGRMEDYVLITTKEGSFWRRKRGTVKPATLNTKFAEAAQATRIISPVARRIRLALLPYLNGLTTGRLNTRIGNQLRKSLQEKNTLKLGYLQGVELQQDHSLDEMLAAGYRVSMDDQNISILIPLELHALHRPNNLATHYYFEAVLLFGDLNKESGLQTTTVSSPPYAFNSNAQTNCSLTLPLPADADWCLLLRLACMQGNSAIADTSSYRMKIIAGKAVSQ
jgi:hypothetical protein